MEYFPEMLLHEPNTALGTKDEVLEIFIKYKMKLKMALSLTWYTLNCGGGSLECYPNLKGEYLKVWGYLLKVMLHEPKRMKLDS